MPADTSTLAPTDAAVALASFPRRFRSAVAVASARSDDRQPIAGDHDLDPDELARRHGPDGTSAIDHVLVADGLLTLLTRTLEEVRRGVDAIVHPAIFDPTQRSWVDDHSKLDDLLDQLSAAAVSAADATKALHGDDWAVRVTVAGGAAPRPVIDVLRSVVATVADELGAVETAIRAAMR